jgi:hypothetical protein
MMETYAVPLSMLAIEAVEEKAQPAIGNEIEMATSDQKTL